MAGPSASGKSSAVSGILEELVQLRYQFCLLDPEGDYEISPECYRLELRTSNRIRKRRCAFWNSLSKMC